MVHQFDIAVRAADEADTILRFALRAEHRYLRCFDFPRITARFSGFPKSPDCGKGPARLADPVKSYEMCSGVGRSAEGFLGRLCGPTKDRLREGSRRRRSIDSLVCWSSIVFEDAV